MKSIVLSSLLLCLAALEATATVINVGPTNQQLVLTGQGLNVQGQAQALVTWGSCKFDGTYTTCTVTGPFTGLGSGGNVSIVLQYSGNGPSPMIATFPTPGSNFFILSIGASATSFLQTVAETNGPTVNFYYSTFSNSAFPNAVCTLVSTCNPAQVAQTPNATLTGVATFSSDLTPVIRSSQGVITAGQFGAFNAIAPGTWMEVYGVNLGTVLNYGWSGSDFKGTQAPNALAGTTVTVAGKPAFIDYVNWNQVNAQVPSDVPTGLQPVVVTTAGGSSTAYMINVNTVQPGLLAPSVFYQPAGQYVAALFPDGLTYVLPPGLTNAVPTRRAKPGETILLYGVGFGPVTPDNPAGIIEGGQNTLNANFQISIGGQPAQFTYDGLTPTYVGLYQFNVVIPNVTASDATSVTFSDGTTKGTQSLIIPIGN